MKTALTLLILACGLVLSGCASTSSQQASATAQAVSGVTVGEYREFLNELDHDIQEGTPRELTSAEKGQYWDLSETMHDILDNQASDSAIPAETSQPFLNIHESILAVVMGSQEGEVVCRGGERSTGSNISSRRCTTRNQPGKQQREVMRYFEQGLE